MGAFAPRKRFNVWYCQVNVDTQLFNHFSDLILKDAYFNSYFIDIVTPSGIHIEKDFTKFKNKINIAA